MTSDYTADNSASKTSALCIKIKRVEPRGVSVTGSRAARSGPSRSEPPLSSAASARSRPRETCSAPISPGSMARRAVEAVARAHRRCRRLLAPLAPRTGRVAAGLALVLAVSFALPLLPGIGSVAHAEGIDRGIASWWEDRKYIDPVSSDYKPMATTEWAQGFQTGACEGGDGFKLIVVMIAFQDPSTDGDTEDRLKLTLHNESSTGPGSTTFATFRQLHPRIVIGRHQTQEEARDGYYRSVGKYVPTSEVILQPNAKYVLKLVDPAVDGDDADVSTAAVSLTESDDEAPTRSNAGRWRGENKWKIRDYSLYRSATTTGAAWNQSDDTIRMYIGARSEPFRSCGSVDEPPEPINVGRVVRTVPEDWPLVPTGARVGDRFRLLFITKDSHDATATDIATYNSFVQSQCTSGGVTAIQAYCLDFRAVGGTASVSTRVNTYTQWRGVNLGVPVYWMNSTALSADLVTADVAPFFYGLDQVEQSPALAAIHYQYFYLWWLNLDKGARSDGTIENVSNLSGFVWTGSSLYGSHGDRPRPLGNPALPADRTYGVRVGHPGWAWGYVEYSPVHDARAENPTKSYPFYGISPIFKVVPATANAEVLPELTVANVAAFESGNGTEVDFTFDVVLSFESDNEVTVYYETEDDTAEAGLDYTALAKTELTFAPGETRKQVTVKVLDDTIEDSGEIFYLKFSDPSGAVLDPNLDQGRATGMIFNAETETPEVSIAAGSAYAQEGAEAVFTLSRSGDAAEALTVPVTVAEEGSVLGTPVPESASFAAGATETELRVPTENDSLDEPDGKVTVTLAEAFEWQLAEGASSASVTVLDDDSPAVPPGTASCCGRRIWRCRNTRASISARRTRTCSRTWAARRGFR